MPDSTEEVVEQPLMGLYDPVCHDLVRANIQSFVQTGKVKHRRLQLVTRDGATIDVSLDFTPIYGDDGTLRYSNAVWRDITDLKQAQRALEHEKRRSEELLLNVLPEPIAMRLRDEEGPIADAFEEISVLFADVVGFTPLSARLDARETVAVLNEVFTAFDAICQRHDVEKVRTIGDGYMVIAGAPVPRDDHAIALAHGGWWGPSRSARFDPRRQTSNKSAEHLVAARAVVLIARLAEQRTELLLAQHLAARREQLEQLEFLEIPGNAQLLDHLVVAQVLWLHRGLARVAGTAAGDDQPIQKLPQPRLGATTRLSVFGRDAQVDGLFDGDRLPGERKDLDHFVVADLQCLAQGAHDVVVVHGDLGVPDSTKLPPMSIAGRNGQAPLHRCGATPHTSAWLRLAGRSAVPQASPQRRPRQGAAPQA